MLKTVKFTEAQFEALTALLGVLVQEVPVEPVSEPKVCSPKAKKAAKVVADRVVSKTQSKAERKEKNQHLTRQINGQLANATKAHKAGDTEGVEKALKDAMALCPSHWASVASQIERKAEALA